MFFQIKYTSALYTAFILILLAGNALGHGLMVEPPARNAHCGLNEKPDRATSPACMDAFKSDFSGGYQFMSVLSHTTGRAGGTTQNVCGFDSETWQGGATPWDTPTDWPTTPIDSGPLTITWNISWGPHYDDTEEFRYYITKPGFQFQKNASLNWSDFESDPFCVLKYDDKNPGANPNVIAEKSAALFRTTCEIPSRTGRHVIYGEWGRNHYTYERFHGCIDVTFGGSNPPTAPPQNQIPVAEGQSVRTTAGSSAVIVLSGADSDGEILGYNVSSQPSNGTLRANEKEVIYTPDSGFFGSDSFEFTLTDDKGATSIPATITILVQEASSDPPAPPQEGSGATCEHVVVNAWKSGFQGAIRIINTSETPISGWQVNWQYGDGSAVSHLWGARLSGDGPYAASHLDWNKTIYPGQRIEFGFIGSGSPESMPEVTGEVCN